MKYKIIMVDIKKYYRLPELLDVSLHRWDKKEDGCNGVIRSFVLR